MADMEKIKFLTAEDVSQITGVSRSKAYKIIQGLNKDLKEQGYITFSGRISQRYFCEKVAL